MIGGRFLHFIKATFEPNAENQNKKGIFTSLELWKFKEAKCLHLFNFRPYFGHFPISNLKMFWIISIPKAPFLRVTVPLKVQTWNRARSFWQCYPRFRSQYNPWPQWCSYPHRQAFPTNSKHERVNQNPILTRQG